MDSSEPDISYLFVVTGNTRGLIPFAVGELRDPHLSKSANKPFRPPFYSVAVHSSGNVLSRVQRIQHPLLDVFHDLVTLALHLTRSKEENIQTDVSGFVVG